MDYEKLHKDTIAKLQEMVNNGKITVEIARGICADFAPESEDERMRKALMQNLKERFGTKGNMGEGLDMPDVLAWFEKQGEQKSYASETTNEKGDFDNGFTRMMEKEQKPAWSEEDEDNMMMIEDRLSDYLDYIREDTSLTKHQKNSMKEEVIGYVNWLKSLKERYTWKPSEEQIEALNRAMYHVEDDVATQIAKLIGDLKKLKGE